MFSLSKEFDEEYRTNLIACVFFRVDYKKVLLIAEGSSKKYPSTIKHEHYTVCQVLGGKYLFHFTPETIENK